MTKYYVYETATNLPVGVFNSKSIAQARLAFKAHITSAKEKGLTPLSEVLSRYTIEEFNVSDTVPHASDLMAIQVAVRNHELMCRRRFWNEFHS